MKDNPLAQAVRETRTQQGPVDMARLMQMVEEIHRAVVKDLENDKNEIVTTQQSHA